MYYVAVNTLGKKRECMCLEHRGGEKRVKEKGSKNRNSKFLGTSCTVGKWHGTG